MSRYVTPVSHAAAKICGLKRGSVAFSTASALVSRISAASEAGRRRRPPRRRSVRRRARRRGLAGALGSRSASVICSKKSRRAGDGRDGRADPSGADDEDPHAESRFKHIAVARSAVWRVSIDEMRSQSGRNATRCAERMPSRSGSPPQVTPRRGPVAPARRVDDLDRRIIEALQENGRESFRGIAARLGVSEATVRARYARLCKRRDPPGGRGDEPARARVRAGARRRPHLGPVRGRRRRDRTLARSRLRCRHRRPVRPPRRGGRRRPERPSRPDEPDARARRRRLHRDLLLPRDVEAALRLGNTDETGRPSDGSPRPRAEIEDLQQAARDHLWLHFTRMGGHEAADHRARRRLLPRGRARQPLPRRARRALLGQHRLRLRRGGRPGRARADARAALLHELDVRAPARDRARRPRSPRSPRAT